MEKKEAILAIGEIGFDFLDLEREILLTQRSITHSIKMICDTVLGYTTEKNLFPLPEKREAGLEYIETDTVNVLPCLDETNLPLLPFGESKRNVALYMLHFVGKRGGSRGWREPSKYTITIGEYLDNKALFPAGLVPLYDRCLLFLEKLQALNTRLESVILELAEKACPFEVGEEVKLRLPIDRLTRGIVSNIKRGFDLNAIVCEKNLNKRVPQKLYSLDITLVTSKGEERDIKHFISHSFGTQTVPDLEYHNGKISLSYGDLIGIYQES